VKKQIFLFFALLLYPSFDADTRTATSEADRGVFNAGVAAFDAGKYPEAISHFGALLKSSGENAELHFNLGDSYFRNKELGRAIFEFRKAHDLSPRDPDLKFNLYYARKRVPDRVEERGVSSLLAKMPWTEKEGWYSVALASILFWGMGLVVLFRPDPRLKWVQAGAFGVLVAALVATGVKRASVHPFGVVVAAESEVYSGLGKDNVLLFKLHEGVEFSVGDREGEWVQVALADGKKGWIRAKDVVL